MLITIEPYIGDSSLPHKKLGSLTILTDVLHSKISETEKLQLIIRNLQKFGTLRSSSIFIGCVPGRVRYR